MNYIFEGKWGIENAKKDRRKLVTHFKRVKKSEMERVGPFAKPRAIGHGS